MKKFKHLSLNDYLQGLSAREPVPGGGSAAACAGALGVSVLLMALRYSDRRMTTASLRRRYDAHKESLLDCQKRLIELVDEDARAFQRFQKTKNRSAAERKQALKEIEAIPGEMVKLMRRARKAVPFLEKNGSPHLAGDIHIGSCLLAGAGEGAGVLTKQTGS